MTGFWDGLIDEVGVFSRAPSAAEVRSIFEAGSGGMSAVAGGVVVDLRAGTATGLRGGVANIRNVVGSAGNDILVGNGGNVLRGGAGRDLLIAGAGRQPAPRRRRRRPADRRHDCLRHRLDDP